MRRVKSSAQGFNYMVSMYSGDLPAKAPPQISIGSYLHVVADQAILSNSYATNYVTNLASYVAGVCSQLDEKVALTNQTLSVTQMPGLYYTPGQLDSLTQARINVLRYKGPNTSPALLHDMTQATSASDYTTVLRVRIKGLVVSTMLSIGDPFIGSSSLGGLQLTSLKTALDNGLSQLSQRGYISNPSVTISSTRSVRPEAPKNLRARARERRRSAPQQAGHPGDLEVDAPFRHREATLRNHSPIRMAPQHSTRRIHDRICGMPMPA